MKHLIVLVAFIAVVLPGQALAQDNLYGKRLVSIDGALALPVASVLLCSTAEQHLGRGSINAWDLCAPLGTPIFAAASGKVILANCGNQGGYGCWVKIDHGNGATSSYAHMIEGSIKVKPGDIVSQNTLLGQVGWTGQTSFGPHVHFVMQKNGVHVDPDRVWDIGQMQRCNLCSSPAGSALPTGFVGSTQQPAELTQAVEKPTTRLDAIATNMSKLSYEDLRSLLIFAFAILAIVWWFGGYYVRVFVTCSSAVFSTIVLIGWLMTPVGTAQPVGVAGGTSGWKQAYPIIQRNEGFSCTFDPIKTMGGVTQGTYNRWRSLRGLPQADVCKSLTRDEAEQVYYMLYWVPTGADKMPLKLALTVVDHYINTGEYKDGLSECGLDVACFNEWRLKDYATKKNCSLYCTAWTNRVNKIRKYTGG